MPFRWKKNTRFSQLVADHLQSPKHGGSLVVETGFPTSLIDLYVRNRGRFRKSSAKRPKGNDSSITSSDSFVDSSNLSFCGSDRTGIDEIIDDSKKSEVEIKKFSSDSFVDSNNLSFFDPDRTGIDEIIDGSSKREVEISKFSSDSFVDSKNFSFFDPDQIGIDEIIDDSSKREAEIVNFSSNSNNLSFGGSDRSDRSGICKIINEDVVETDDSSKKSEVEMAKLNPVVVAALKALFVVVLMLGTKRFKFGITVSAFVLFFLELVGKPLLERSISIRLTRRSVDPKTPFQSKGDNGNKNMKDSKENNSTLFVCNQVVEIEEQVEEDSKEKVIIRSERELDETRSENSMEIRHKSSRRAMMKSRMKKLVPKKLRKSSMGSKGEISIGSSECSKLCVSNEEQNKIVKIEIEGPCTSTKVDCGKKKSGKESGENYGCLVLCLIVLIGLIGGRVLALVLALTWCLIQKKSPTTMEKCKVSNLLI